MQKINQLRSKILYLFSDLTSSYTIREVSKLLKKSYASVNYEIQAMIKDGLLNARNIGHSILCEMNKDALSRNEVLLSNVIFNLSFISSFLSLGFKVSENIRKILDDNSVVVAYYYDKKYYLYTNKAFRGIKNVVFCSLDDSLIPENLNPKNVVILKGVDLFWRRLYG